MGYAIDAGVRSQKSELKIMNTIRVKFIEKMQRTPTVASFRFKPEVKLDFVPGQFLRIIFDESNENNKNLNKYLSFSSSPGKDYIEVTKRLTESEFCQKLKDLKADDVISIKGPIGNCLFKEEYNKVAFLIGGIGITPVISILEYIIEKQINTDAALFYSNRTEEEIAFRNELNGFLKENKNIHVCYTVTDRKPSDQACISGRINKELLLKKIIDWPERKVFIFGPPKMVEAMKELALEVGCRKDSLMTESFIGY